MRYVIILLILLLSACISPAETKMPAYFVMLVQIAPNVSARCSGIALDQWTILTANHCLDRGTLRIETQYGQTSLVYTAQRFPEHDLALVYSMFPLSLPEYARLGVANTYLPASLFGVCPQHFSHVPRETNFSTSDWTNKNNISCEKWIVQSSACGSDSGGLLVQDNQVIGLTIAIKNWWPSSGTLEGKEVCVVPSQVIMETISWQTVSNN